MIDLKRWKEQQIENRLMKFIAMKKGHIQQGDQGALNHVLSHDVYCFQPKYNSVTIFYDFSYKELLEYRKPVSGYYNENLIKVAVEDPVLIHFTTSFLSKRPWMKGCRHIYCREWRRYKHMSPWKDEPLRDDPRRPWKIHIFRMLPRAFAIFVASWFQVYGRPFKNAIKYSK